jgi:hypothetical protein
LTCSGDLAPLSVTTQFTQPVAAPLATPLSTPAAPAAQPASTNGALTLLQPLDARLYGRRSFRWQTNVALKPNQGFELIFWEVGQDPLTKGFSLVGPKTESAADVDLDKLGMLLPQLKPNKEYGWGVLLVQLRPYRPLQYLGGGHRFLFGPPPPAGSGDGGGDASPTAAPAPPPKAPPK